MELLEPGNLFMTTPESASKVKRRLRYFLISLTAFAATVGLFYAEEDWRGWRAMYDCKAQLQARGVNLDWQKEIPPPVPDDQNVFGVREIQNAFTGHGYREFMKTPSPNFPGWTKTNRMVVARLVVGAPGTTPPPDYTLVQWDGTNTAPEINALIRKAFGPVALDSRGPVYIREPASAIKPPKIYLTCLQTPNEKEIKNLAGAPILCHEEWAQRQYEESEISPNGSAYVITMIAPSTVEEYLGWAGGFEQGDELLRNALKRPYARLKGDYSRPSQISIPNFINLRNISQRLAAMARCHLLLDQPEKALRDLTLINDICRRMLEDNKPMTLVSAMINVAVRGLAMSVINDGLQSHAWREPQLAALERQLQPINLLGPVQEAFKLERFSLCYHLSTETPAQYLTNFDYDSHGTSVRAPLQRRLLRQLIPDGWAGQNMARGAKLYVGAIESVDPAAGRIYPERVTAASRRVSDMFARWSPYAFMASVVIPNTARACQTTAFNQTMVNQTRIACALERYRLARGEYPKTLDALAPQFLDSVPTNVIGGQPPHYYRDSDGQFTLYSIGWDRQDHGGIGHANASQPGDWVWPEK
jgi:hypothetical protein